MEDILSKIIADKRHQVEAQKRMLPASEIERRITPRKALSMSGSLAASRSGIIAEFKRRSPSKGWISRHAQPEVVVPAYCSAGASALSILTDEPYFGGSLADIAAVRDEVQRPVLRKEFIIDPWQLLESRMAGADAVLLIAAALSVQQCCDFTRMAHQLGMEVLLEIHSEQELEYTASEADMIGVNNRNLGTFHTDIQNSFRLAGLLPADRVLVSESGISNPQTVCALRQAGFRGFLIGESFMRTLNPAQTLRSFIGEVERC